MAGCLCCREEIRGRLLPVSAVAPWRLVGHHHLWTLPATGGQRLELTQSNEVGANVHSKKGGTRQTQQISILRKGRWQGRWLHEKVAGTEGAVSRGLGTLMASDSVQKSFIQPVLGQRHRRQTQPAFPVSNLEVGNPSGRGSFLSAEIYVVTSETQTRASSDRAKPKDKR
jgi:hypothetical protein